jgi:hypothetical protein
MEGFTMSDSLQEKIKKPTQDQPLLFDNRTLISFLVLSPTNACPSVILAGEIRFESEHERC